MRTARVVPGTVEHAKALAPFLRESDIKEARAMGVEDPGAGLVKSVEVSEKCWAVLDGDTVVAMFGVDSLDAVWLLGSDRMREHGHFFYEAPKLYLAEMLWGRESLWNFVHAENFVSLRWLKTLGFSLLDPVAMGPLGEKFRPVILLNERTA